MAWHPEASLPPCAGELRTHLYPARVSVLSRHHTSGGALLKRIAKSSFESLALRVLPHHVVTIPPTLMTLLPWPERVWHAGKKTPRAGADKGLQAHVLAAANDIYGTVLHRLRAHVAEAAWESPSRPKSPLGFVRSSFTLATDQRGRRFRLVRHASLGLPPSPEMQTLNTNDVEGLGTRAPRQREE